MSAWYIISFVLVFLSGYWSYDSFKEGNTVGGWLNLFASAFNAAVILKEVL